MNLKDLNKRLIMLDEEASLLFGTAERFHCVIVGGSALMLLGYSTRATHDIDAIDCHVSLIRLIEKYDINTQVRAHINCFPEDYERRLQKINIPTQVIDYYTLSLEDLVISKVIAGRQQDMFDITAAEIVNDIDWIKLKELALCIEPELLNDRVRDKFKSSLDLYYERCGKEELLK